MAFEKVRSPPKVAGPPVLRGYYRQDKIITLEASSPVGSIRGGGVVQDRGARRHSLREFTSGTETMLLRFFFTQYAMRDALVVEFVRCR